MAAAPWRGIRLFRFVQCNAIPGVREAQLIYIWVSTYKEKRYCRVISNANPRDRGRNLFLKREKISVANYIALVVVCTLYCTVNNNLYFTLFCPISKQSAEWIDHEIAFGVNLTSIGVIFLNCTKYPPIVWKLHLKMTKLRCHDYNGLRRARLVGLFNYIYVKNAHFEVK